MKILENNNLRNDVVGGVALALEKEVYDKIAAHAPGTETITTIISCGLDACVITTIYNFTLNSGKVTFIS